MNTEMLLNEEILKEGAANLQRGAETVGGRLFLTNQRLIFESHSFNVQTGATIVSLENVSQTLLCWTKFLNLIPLTPNSLEVSTLQGEQHRFVLYGRKTWKVAIDEHKGDQAS